jgi:hypothetical protein
MKRILLLGTLLLVTASPLSAQERDAHGWSALRISKWTVAGLSAAAAVYGFTMNREADDLYAQLERDCLADADACRLLGPDGRYLANELETQYQEVLRHDRRARNGLLASQLGVAASVVLFVLDLRNARAPDDILYEPRTLQVGAGRDGGVELRLRLAR